MYQLMKYDCIIFLTYIEKYHFTEENIMGITIRKATPEDANIYTDCQISCFQSAYKGIVSDEYLSNMLAEKDQRVEKYKKTFKDPGDCEYYCVMYEEKMVGFLIVNKNCDKENPGIWAIYLVEEFWGKGYGKEMLNFAINELKHVNPNEISLWVFEENYRARRFYEKHNLSFDGMKREVKYGKSLVQLKYVLNL